VTDVILECDLPVTFKLQGADETADPRSYILESVLMYLSCVVDESVQELSSIAVWTKGNGKRH